MLQNEYLANGIIGLSRITKTYKDGHWFGAHYPAAVIAAYYFCRDHLNADAEAALRIQLGKMMAKYSGIFSVPKIGATVNSGVDAIAQCLKQRASQHSHSGHQAIFAAYAITALQELPHMATGEIIAGILDLVGHFNGTEGVALDRKLLQQQLDIPAQFDEARLADLVFRELAKIPFSVPIEKKHIPIGHVMTNAHALVMLARAGYRDLAVLGYEAFLVHLIQFRNGMKDADASAGGKDWRAKNSPLTARYWETEVEGEKREWEFGHVFKYCHSYFDLKSVMKSATLHELCDAQLSYLI
jgi:hypothetical protein